MVINNGQINRINGLQSFTARLIMTTINNTGFNIGLALFK